MDFAAEQMSAPPADLKADPRAILTCPIRHVVMLNLESIRADVLPLSPHFAETVGTRLRKTLTANDLTPFTNSLFAKSVVMNNTSSTCSYTLKALLSTFCGMYPLNVNFMEEARPDKHYYQQCLPQLVRKHFRDNDLSRPWWKRLVRRWSLPASRFQSAFFQTSESNFDHQQEEFIKMGWDKTFYEPDVRKFSPDAKKLGWFGVGDNDLLPLFFDWVDTGIREERQLLAGILTTSTHYPFPVPAGQRPVNYVTNELVNRYLNSVRGMDGFLKDLMNGFEERGILNETLFVMIGDHGHAFNDWNHKLVGALDNSMENGFRVPFFAYSPALTPIASIERKYTNLDILPTIMDALISSTDEGAIIPISNHSLLTNTSRFERDSALRKTNLLKLSHDENLRSIQAILSRYEGTSIFRPSRNPDEDRLTFHLDNPGNAHMIAEQYPLKLVYDTIGEQTYLYDLSHDPHEWNDLLSIPNSRGHAVPPSWADISPGDLAREFRFNWWNYDDDVLGSGRTPVQRKGAASLVSGKSSQTDMDEDGGKVKGLNLTQAFDWAESSFEMLLAWSWINKERYLTGNKEIDVNSVLR
jgi:Sulfatase